MPRTLVFITVVILLVSSISCKNVRTPAPLVVHVLRDPSGGFAGELSRADLQFALASPNVHSGRSVQVQTNDDVSFMNLPKRLQAFRPDVLILDSAANIPDDPAVRNQLGEPEHVCGGHPAFVPSSVSGEQREAAEMYLRFLVSRCGTNVTQTTGHH